VEIVTKKYGGRLMDDANEGEEESEDSRVVARTKQLGIAGQITPKWQSETSGGIERALKSKEVGTSMHFTEYLLV